MNKSKLYHLIVDPRYRMWRHILLMLTLAIISFNQMFIAYQDYTSLLGNKIYLICLAWFSTYMIATYINYFVLTPKLLLKEKYIPYIALLVVLVFSWLFFSISLEYAMRTWLALPHRISSYSNPLILLVSLSSSMMTIICFWSFSVIALFRQWSKKNEDIVTLEYEFLQSEINKLKGQVSPHFFSETLQNVSALVTSNPDKASDILMKLGQLLRYQLYDCNRDQVLLSSEINLTNNFLKVKKLLNNRFVYSMDIKGNTNNTLISPLLLIVLIQSVLEINELNEIDVIFEVRDNTLLLDCCFSEKAVLSAKEVVEMSEKLEVLYKAQYSLTVEPGTVRLQLKLK